MTPISDIHIRDRFRRDLGDVAALARSISEVGLLHPVVVTADGTLIAGERRLRAALMLGWTEIPVTVVDLEDIRRGEYAENTARKDFLPSEVDAIRRAMAPVVATPVGRPSAATVETFHNSDTGKTRDKIGAFAGMSGRTVEKIAHVVEAARAEPERFAPLVAEMDRTGKVDGAYRKLRAAQDEQTILETKPVVGRHRTIVIDPPWDYEGLSLAGRGMPTYAVMSHDELLALPVGEWAETDCHLYLWATNNFLTRAVDLMAAWGFQYKTVLTWVKPRIGLGSYFRNSTEQCLFGVRGDMTTRVKDIPTHFEAPTTEHSEKPEHFFSIVERASYPTYLEAFARKQREGWSSWGNGV